jgi:hypothetical protein
MLRYMGTSHVSFNLFAVDKLIVIIRNIIIAILQNEVIFGGRKHFEGSGFCCNFSIFVSCSHFSQSNVASPSLFVITQPMTCSVSSSKTRLSRPINCQIMKFDIDFFV